MRVAYECHAIALITKTAKLKVENLAQITFGFSPVDFCTPSVHSKPYKHEEIEKSKKKR
jgi:hypothetical protein